MTALLKEVADVLTRYGWLNCTLSVERDRNDVVTVTVKVGTGVFESLSLFHDLQYLQDITQLRALAQKYDIDSAALEALLPREK